MYYKWLCFEKIFNTSNLLVVFFISLINSLSFSISPAYWKYQNYHILTNIMLPLLYHPFFFDRLQCHFEIRLPKEILPSQDNWQTLKTPSTWKKLYADRLTWRLKKALDFDWRMTVKAVPPHKREVQDLWKTWSFSTSRGCHPHCPHQLWNCCVESITITILHFIIVLTQTYPLFFPFLPPFCSKQVTSLSNLQMLPDRRQLCRVYCL